MFANFIEFIESDLFNAALEKIIECIKIVTPKQSTLKDVSKPVTRCQPWYEDECESFRCKTLKALRYLRRTSSFESLSTYQSFKKPIEKLLKRKKEKFKQEQTEKLEKVCDDKNPKEFRRFLKAETKSSSERISKNEWLNTLLTFSMSIMS